MGISFFTVTKAGPDRAVSDGQFICYFCRTKQKEAVKLTAATTVFVVCIRCIDSITTEYRNLLLNEDGPMPGNKPNFERGQIIVGSLAQLRTMQCDRVICDAGADYLVVRHVVGSSKPDFVSGEEFSTLSERLYSDRWVYVSSIKTWYPMPNEGVSVPEILT